MGFFADLVAKESLVCCVGVGLEPLGFPKNLLRERLAYLHIRIPGEETKKESEYAMSRTDEQNTFTHPMVVCEDFTYPKVACLGGMMSSLYDVLVAIRSN